MFGFLLRLAIALPLFAVLVGLSVVALVIEAISPAQGQRPSPLHLIGNYVNRG